MPHYKIVLTGGERADRYKFANELNLKPADYTGHQVVFYKEHPANEATLQRNYQSLAGKKFEVGVELITKDEYNS